ncbi:hypothetical protein CAEBREN_05477 [Caenorhabditis brenneri]|uniref:C6 domain-containing protein n=1 Tax=Caenorhabditis brenneri TaxID=135651 RepID=G0P712_CAEBE|nr:hypothetical protein CAEBREN_05477 [Caenorhabditis brenneri]
MILSVFTILILHFSFTHSCMAVQNSSTATISCVRLEGEAEDDSVGAPETSISGNTLTVACSSEVTNVNPQVTYNGQPSGIPSISMTCEGDEWQYTPTGGTPVTVTSIGCSSI